MASSARLTSSVYTEAAPSPKTPLSLDAKSSGLFIARAPTHTKSTSEGVSPKNLLRLSLVIERILAASADSLLR